MKTYEIKYEPVTVDGNTINKYNVYYTGGEWDGQKEFYAYDLDSPVVKIREGYVQK